LIPLLTDSLLKFSFRFVFGKNGQFALSAPQVNSASSFSLVASRATFSIRFLLSFTRLCRSLSCKYCRGSLDSIHLLVCQWSYSRFYFFLGDLLRVFVDVLPFTRFLPSYFLEILAPVPFPRSLQDVLSLIYVSRRLPPPPFIFLELD